MESLGKKCLWEKQPVRNFDIEVMKRELIRDVDVANCKEIPIVETWHIGNMAYILSRNRDLFLRYSKIFAQKLQFFEPFAILVKINSETFRSRIREKIDVRDITAVEKFYREIFKNTCNLYMAFRINYIVVNNDQELSKSMAKIINTIKINTLKKTFKR